MVCFNARLLWRHRHDTRLKLQCSCYTHCPALPSGAFACPSSTLHTALLFRSLLTASCCRVPPLVCQRRLRSPAAAQQSLADCSCRRRGFYCRARLIRLHALFAAWSSTAAVGAAAERIAAAAAGRSLLTAPRHSPCTRATCRCATECRSVISAECGSVEQCRAGDGGEQTGRVSSRAAAAAAAAVSRTDMDAVPPAGSSSDSQFTRATTSTRSWSSRTCSRC